MTLCPIDTFSGLPHVLESIFFACLSDYKDFYNCKQVNQTWKRVLEDLETKMHLKDVFKEKRFVFDWFMKRPEVLRISEPISNHQVHQLCFVAKEKWLIMELYNPKEESRSLLAFDVMDKKTLIPKKINWPACYSCHIESNDAWVTLGVFNLTEVRRGSDLSLLCHEFKTECSSRLIPYPGESDFFLRFHSRNDSRTVCSLLKACSNSNRLYKMKTFPLEETMTESSPLSPTISSNPDDPLRETEASSRRHSSWE